jgi:hypothetical protein
VSVCILTSQESLEEYLWYFILGNFTIKLSSIFSFLNFTHFTWQHVCTSTSFVDGIWDSFWYSMNSFSWRIYVMLNTNDTGLWMKDKLMSCHVFVCCYCVACLCNSYYIMFS